MLTALYTGTTDGTTDGITVVSDRMKERFELFVHMCTFGPVFKKNLRSVIMNYNQMYVLLTFNVTFDLYIVTFDLCTVI